MVVLDRVGVRFRRGKRILKREGFYPFFKQVVSFLANSFFSYETHCVYENTLEQVGGNNFTPKMQDLTLEIISAQEEINRLLADGYDFSFYHNNIEEDRERLNKEAILFCAFAGKELAHKSWLAMSGKAKKYVDRYPYKVDYQTEACIGSTATNPRYYNMGIYTYVYFRIYQYIKGENKERAIFVARKDNVAVQKSQAKLGSRICGEGYHLRLLFLWEFWRLRPRKNDYSLVE